MTGALFMAGSPLSVSLSTLQVIGTVTRINRQAATVALLTVDGKPCRADYTGMIRIQDIRQTETDKVKVHNSFRPGDVVRSKVVSWSNPVSLARRRKIAVCQGRPVELFPRAHPRAVLLDIAGRLTVVLSLDGGESTRGPLCRALEW